MGKLSAFAVLLLVTSCLQAAVPAPPLQVLSGVWRADFNADASRVIVQHREGMLGIWDTVTGDPVPGDLGNLTIRGTYVTDAKAGRALVGLEGGGSRVFDLTTGAALSPMLEVSFEGSWNPPAGFSPDGTRVQVFEKAGRLVVLEVASGKKIAELDLPAGTEEREVSPSVAFSEDGNTALVLDGTGTLRRYHARTWQAEGEPMPHPDRDAYYVGFALSPDARHAVTFDSPGENGPMGSLQLWDLTTSRPLGEPLREQNGLSGRFLGNDRFLVTPGRGATRVVQVPSLETAIMLPRHDDVEASKATPTADGSHLISWGYNATVRSTDARTGKHAAIFSNRSQIQTVLTAPGSVWLAMDNTAFFREHHYDYYVVRLDPAEMRPKATLRLTGYLHRTILSPDATRLMVHEGGTHKERIRIFDAKTLKELPSTAAR